MNEGGRSGSPPVLPWARHGQPGDAPGAAAALAAALPHEGSIAVEPALRLLYLAAAVAATGRLEVAAPFACFTLWFRRGGVEHASSDAAEDDVGAFLVARGAITPADLARAATGLDPAGDDLVSKLATSGALRAEAFRLVQEHGVRLVARAISASTGTFRWSPGGAAPPSAFPLASPWGLPCAAVRHLDAEVARSLLGERALRVASRSRGRIDLSQLELNAHEARAAGLFDGRTSPAALAAARSSEAGAILKTALLLAETELLTFGEVVPAPPTASPAAPVATRVPPAAPARAAPAAAKPGPRPAAKAPVDRTPPRDDVASLKALDEKLRSAGHFEALAVGRNATPAAIKTSYLQLAKRYHPDSGSPEDPPEMQKLRADIFARIGEAWSVLGDDTRRAEYARQLELGGGADVDVTAILRAEETFRKATALVNARRYEEATRAFEQAIALNPQEPEFDVWLAWVRFAGSEARERQHAASVSAIEAALRKVPRCVVGYLFLSRMARLTGDAAGAERHLKRGLAAVPEAPDLLRELKSLRK